MDAGLTPVLHQHTGTCVEKRRDEYLCRDGDGRYAGDEIRPRHMASLQKGGSDPVQVVKRFSPADRAYAPEGLQRAGRNILDTARLGEGKVDIPAILALMEGRQTAGLVMVELDSPPPQPVPAIETAKVAKAYLEKQGVTFRSVRRQAQGAEEMSKRKETRTAMKGIALRMVLTVCGIAIAQPFAVGPKRSPGPDYGGGTDSSHYAKSKQITKANVGQMEVALGLPSW